MIAKDKIINFISTGFFLLVNFIFLLKYTSRYFENFILLTFLFLLVQIIILTLIEKFIPGDQKISGKGKFYFLLVPLFIFYLTLLLLAPAETRVSRAEAAIYWLKDLFNGVFPYGTEKNPSGFPVNFLLIAPFHLIGNIGYLQVITITALYFFVISTSRFLKELIFRGFLILSAVPLYYELIVKSEIFSNVMVFLILSYFIIKKADEEKWEPLFFITAIIAGLLLSTRLVIYPLLLILVLYKFRYNLIRASAFYLISAAVFFLTLLPFLFWNYQEFMLKGPFAVQSIYLPPILMALIIIIAVYAGWSAANKNELYFGTGIVLFLAVTFSFLITVADAGLYQAIFNDRFDISYFNLCTPFFIAGMYEYRVDYFLGKLLPYNED